MIEGGETTLSMVPLNTVCRPKQWKTISTKDFTADGFPVYGANGRIGFYSEFNHEQPTIMIACRGATCGRINISEPRSYINGNAMALDELDERRTDFDFLAHYLAYRGFEDVISGSAQPQITREGLAAVRIPLPSLREQKRIAAILDAADALREKRRQAIAKLDTLLQSVFLDMFGDPATNPKGWNSLKLGTLIQEGPQNGLYKPASDYGTGTPILRIDAFYDGAVTDITSLKRVKVSDTEKSKYALTEGDVVINRVNSLPYLGKCALIPPLSEDTVYESNMMRMRFDDQALHARFAVHFLQTGFVKQQIQKCAKHAVNQASINQQDVKHLRLLVPPIELQETFAKRVLAIESRRASYNQSRDGMEGLFASLQQRAFRGEL